MLHSGRRTEVMTPTQMVTIVTIYWTILTRIAAEAFCEFHFSISLVWKLMNNLKIHSKSLNLLSTLFANWFSYDDPRRKFLLILFSNMSRHFTREALPRLDNYRDILSVQAVYRPTLDDLHNATMSNKVSIEFTHKPKPSQWEHSFI